MPDIKQDYFWMKKALDLAKKGWGHVSPNPMVGCLIVAEGGRLIGQGYHRCFGSFHAEIEALEDARSKSGNLENATIYINLEPCSIVGRTPACAPILAKLPIRRVVIAMKDPNPLINGRGIHILENAGIEVTNNVLFEEAQRLNEVFIHTIQEKKIFIILKIVQSKDGFIAHQDKTPHKISHSISDRLIHYWRAGYDAILIGAHTLRTDQPRLTVRHYDGRQPYRIVFGGHSSILIYSNLFTDRHREKTILVIPNNYRHPLPNCLVISVEPTVSGIDCRQGLKKLYDIGNYHLP